MYAVGRPRPNHFSHPGTLHAMPVIVIGADTTFGRAVIDALLPRDGEVRAFVSDPDEGEALRGRGLKVAVGDVSDGSHIGAAALRTFCAVLSLEAAIDERERSFAGSPDAVVAAWAEGLRDAGVQRVIVLDDDRVPAAAQAIDEVVAEVAWVATAARDAAEAASEVAGLEAAERIR